LATFVMLIQCKTTPVPFKRVSRDHHITGDGDLTKSWLRTAEQDLQAVDMDLVSLRRHAQNCALSIKQSRKRQRLRQDPDDDCPVKDCIPLGCEFLRIQSTATFWITDKLEKIVSKDLV